MGLWALGHRRMVRALGFLQQVYPTAFPTVAPHSDIRSCPEPATTCGFLGRKKGQENLSLPSDWLGRTSVLPRGGCWTMVMGKGQDKSSTDTSQVVKAAKCTQQSQQVRIKSWLCYMTLGKSLSPIMLSLPEVKPTSMPKITRGVKVG